MSKPLNEQSVWIHLQIEKKSWSEEWNVGGLIVAERVAEIEDEQCPSNHPKLESWRKRWATLHEHGFFLSWNNSPYKTQQRLAPDGELKAGSYLGQKYLNRVETLYLLLSKAVFAGLFLFRTMEQSRAQEVRDESTISSFLFIDNLSTKKIAIVNHYSTERVPTNHRDPNPTRTADFHLALFLTAFKGWS